MFCEGNEDVPPPSKVPFVRRPYSTRQGGREEGRGPFSKFTWRLRDESAGAIIFGEMHINILLMEGLELLLWYSNNILRGARSTKAVKYKGRANALIFGYSPLLARLRGRT